MLISGSQVKDALISGVDVYHVCMEYDSIEDFSVAGTLASGKNSLLHKDSQGRIWNQLTAAGVQSGHSIVDAEFYDYLEMESGYCHMVYSTDIEDIVGSG